MNNYHELNYLKETHNNLYDVLHKMCCDNQYEIILCERDYILVKDINGNHKVVEFKCLGVKLIDVTYAPVITLLVGTEFYVYNGDWNGKIVINEGEKCILSSIGFYAIPDDYRLIMIINKEGEIDMNKMNLFNKAVSEINKLFIYSLTVYKDEWDKWKLDKSETTVEGPCVLSEDGLNYITEGKFSKVWIPRELKVIDYALGKQCRVGYPSKLCTEDEEELHLKMISEIKVVLLKEMLEYADKVRAMTLVLDRKEEE